jgi:hypothetical protein
MPGTDRVASDLLRRETAPRIQPRFENCLSLHLKMRLSMIPKSELIEMFEAIAEQTDWDMTGEMLWGYFFTDDAPEKLEVCAKRLTEMGYHLVEISEGDESDDPFTLHVEKIEVHSPETLDKRNQELAAFATEAGVGSYDGMDVGPVDGDDDDFDDDDENEDE